MRFAEQNVNNYLCTMLAVQRFRVHTLVTYEKSFWKKNLLLLRFTPPKCICICVFSTKYSVTAKKTDWLRIPKITKKLVEELQKIHFYIDEVRLDLPIIKMYLLSYLLLCLNSIADKIENPSKPNDLDEILEITNSSE